MPPGMGPPGMGPMPAGSFAPLGPGSAPNPFGPQQPPNPFGPQALPGLAPLGPGSPNPFAGPSIDPLSLGAPGGVALPSANPYSAPSKSSFSDDSGSRSGLPWEGRHGGFTETVSKVLFDSDNAFRKMSLTTGLWTPLSFAMAGFAIYFGVVMAFYLFGFLFGMAGIVDSSQSAEASARAAGFVVGVIIGAAIAYALGLGMSLVGCFIGAGISHLCLLMVGGAKRDYTATLRVICYCNGANWAFGAIPFAGIVTIVTGPLSMINGLAAVHGISKGKSALAVFLPLILICGGFLLLCCGGTGLGSFVGPRGRPFD
jgi:hypothetical protein